MMVVELRCCTAVQALLLGAGLLWLELWWLVVELMVLLQMWYDGRLVVVLMGASLKVVLELVVERMLTLGLGMEQMV